jgi:RHS repeat-associated protein
VTRRGSAGRMGRSLVGCVVGVALVVCSLVSAAPAMAATHVGPVTYNANTTWTVANSPYVLDGDVTVASGVTLSIEPGVVVKFNGQFRRLVVSGAVSALGTQSDPIVFTSYQDDASGGDTNGDGAATTPAPGQWNEVAFSSVSSASQLRYVNVRYGGTGGSQVYAPIHASGYPNNLSLDHVTVTKSQSSAVVADSFAVVMISNSTLTDNQHGLYVNQATATVDHTTLSNNSGRGVFFDLPSSSPYGLPAATRISDSEITGNGQYGVYIGANGDHPFDSLPSGTRNNIYGNNNGGVQLTLVGYPGFVRAPLDWRNNYWGDNVYYWYGDSACLGTGQHSPGHVAYRGAGGTVPDGPFTFTTYSAMKDIFTYVACGADQMKIDATDYATTKFDTSPRESFGLTIGNAYYHAANATVTQSDPVNSASGGSAHAFTDLAFPGTGVPFVFRRSYNSADLNAGELGRGWTDSFAASLTFRLNGDIQLRSEDGQQVEYLKQPDGSYLGEPGARSQLVAVSGGYDLTRTDQVKYHFDSQGRLTSIVDRNAQGLSLTYGSDGKVATVTDSAGRTYTFTHNTDGRLTQIAAPGSRTVSYGYTNGLLTSYTDARGKVWTYTYETHGFLEKEVDPLNHTVYRNVYGSDGRVTEQYDGLGKKTTFSWDPATQTATATDARGNVWKDVYSNGALIKRIDPLNNTTQYGYDTDLNLTSVTDPRGKQTSMTYDSRGNLLTRTAPSPLSYQQTYTYNSANDVVTAQDGRGNTTSYGYDSHGNLTSVTQPGSVVTQYGRDISGNGRLRSITDPRGKATSLDYDSDGNLSAITTSLGNKTTLFYDSSGRLTSSVDPRGNVTGANPDTFRTTYTYNANDQLLTRTDALSNATTYAYDDAGRQTSVTDPKSHVTSYAYDAADHLTTVTAPGSATTTYAYDDVGNITSRTDPNTHVTSYVYDTANRLTSATNPLNKTWSLTYDASGNRTQLTKPSSGTISVSYDALNRPTGVTFSDSTPSVSYSYDGNSNRTQMVDGAGTQNYTYDTLNRVTAITRGSDSFGYSYDDASNVTLRTYPDSASISYGYDNDERMSSVTRSSNTANYSYNPAGLPTQTTLPNSYIDSRTYDAVGRVTQIKHSQGSSVLAQFDYAYDNDSNPTSVTTLSGSETYGYDNRDRLTSVCYQASCPGGSDPFIRWTYDAVGNRLTEARPTGTTNYSYDAADQLTQVGSDTYGFDANGRETQAGSRTYGWNIADQLTSASDGTTSTSYSYDGDGNRLQAASSVATTNYLWDPNGGLPRLAVERNGSGSTLRSYTYGSALSALAMTSGGQNYYFHQDATGSVRNVTSSSAQTEWTYSYEPFGTARTTTKNDPVAPDNQLRFAGELLDSDAALYDLRAREYDPTAGRFLSLDPQSPALASPYEGAQVYGANNPTSYIDPSGLGKVWNQDTAQSAELETSVFDPIVSLLHDCGLPLTYDLMLATFGRDVANAWAYGYRKGCRALQWVAHQAERFATEAAGVVPDVAAWIWKNRETVVNIVGGCTLGALEVEEAAGPAAIALTPGGVLTAGAAGCVSGAVFVTYLGGSRPTFPPG